MLSTPTAFRKILFASIYLIGFILPLKWASAETLTVGYFLEWPTPNQFAQVKKLYDDALDMEIKWVSFDAGTAMSAAMASGDVQISFSQGIPPFVVAVSSGQDLQIVDVAVSYSENDNCVVRTDLDIDASNVTELEGMQAGVPIGTAAHYGFLKQMAHFGVDVTTMKIVDMEPAAGAAAFSNGQLDIVCGWGGALDRMKEHGNILMTGAEKEALGIQVFDATTVSSTWAQENTDVLSRFLKVTADMNRQYAKDQAKVMLPVIAKASGMDDAAAIQTLKGFYFPTIQQQLSSQWLGGGTQHFLKEVADFFVAQGVIAKARENYDHAVDAQYLLEASKLSSQ